MFAGPKWENGRGIWAPLIRAFVRTEREKMCALFSIRRGARASGSATSVHRGGRPVFPSFVVTGIVSAGGVKGVVVRLETKVCERFMKSCGGVFAECFLGEALSESIFEVAQVLEAAVFLRPSK